MPRPIHRHPNLPQFSDHRVRVLHRLRSYVLNPNHLHPASARRLDSCWRILNHQALLWTKSQPLCPHQIRLRMRLSIHHVIRRHHDLRHRQSTMPQSIRRKQPRSGRHHAPPLGRNRFQQIRRARHDDDPTLVVRLMILNGSRFGSRIEMRHHPPDHLDRAHAMRNRHHSVAIHSLARSPLPPLAVHLPRRITKHTIEIKQNGRAGKCRHS